MKKLTGKNVKELTLNELDLGYFMPNVKLKRSTAEAIYTYMCYVIFNKSTNIITKSNIMYEAAFQDMPDPDNADTIKTRLSTYYKNNIIDKLDNDSATLCIYLVDYPCGLTEDELLKELTSQAQKALDNV